MGISPIVSVEVDLSAVKEVACDLLGSSAIADDKTERGTSLVWIGWQQVNITSADTPQVPKYRNLAYRSTAPLFF
jgi:hypothetical protein